PGRQQLLHELGAVALKVAVNLGRHVGPDALHSAELLFSCRSQVLYRAELAGQHARRRIADLGDAESAQESPQLNASTRGYAVDQVLRRLLGETLELFHLVLAQVVKVARVFDSAAVDDLGQGRVTEALDVHGSGEVAKSLEALRATERIDASVRDVRLLAHDISPTHRALRGHLPAWLRVLDADDLGDDIARPVDHHLRAGVHALLVDLGLVVHDYVANRNAALLLGVALRI